MTRERYRARTLRRGPRTGRLALPALILLAVACGSESPTQPPEKSEAPVASCGPLPYFTVLPVAAADLEATAVVGGLGAPGHTLPTDHVALYVTRVNVPVVAPGRIQITSLRRVTYVTSPTRQGKRDYAVGFRACAEVEGWFGHLTSVSPAIPDATSAANCATYSTSDETVETCIAEIKGVTLEAGAALGTAGLSEGLLAADLGLLDTRTKHLYVTPSRFPPGTRNAVCPFEYFDAANREHLLSAMRDRARPGELPAGSPRCGTMAVDVAGTAKGVWAERGVTGQVAGDERRYLTLANYPYRPAEWLALSLGPDRLGARVAVVPRAASGRVNRGFEEVTGDGTLYCYTDAKLPSPTGALPTSWLLSLDASGTLRIEQMPPTGRGQLCDADPASWAFTADVLELVR